MLVNLLHVSQHDWWLEATSGETYPLVDTSSTGVGSTHLVHQNIY